MWVAQRHEGFDRSGFIAGQPKVYTGWVSNMLDTSARGFLRIGLLMQCLAVLGFTLVHYAFGGLQWYTWDLRHTTEVMRSNQSFRNATLVLNILYFFGALTLTAFQCSLSDDAAWSRGYRAGSKMLSYATFFDLLAAAMLTAWAMNFANYYTETMWTHFRQGNLDWIFCTGGRVIHAVALLLYGIAYFLLEVYHDDGTNDWHGSVNLILCTLAGLTELSMLTIMDPALATVLIFVALLSALLWAVAFEEEVNASAPAMNESELCNGVERELEQFTRVNPNRVTGSGPLPQF